MIAFSSGFISGADSKVPPGGALNGADWRQLNPAASGQPRAEKGKFTLRLTGSIRLRATGRREKRTRATCALLSWGRRAACERASGRANGTDINPN